MKSVVTGSLGHISKPLTKALVDKGHSVTVISSNPANQQNIEALGAKAAIGSLEDATFLAKVFTGTDAVYCMEPPVNFQTGDFAVWERIARSYEQAIMQSGIKRVVHLSSIGAHTNKGNGILRLHHEVENILQSLPQDIAITFLRPVGFYYNLFAFIPVIKSQGAIIANYKADYKEPWVSTLDIAAVVAEEMLKEFTGRNIRYIASDELTSDEMVAVLGNAINKPGLKWITVSDVQVLNNMIAAGLSTVAAEGLMEMNAGRRNAVLYEDYFRHRPELGETKMKNFANEFAAVYNNQQ